VATTGGDLVARWVVHTVGPVYHGGTRGEAETLASAYRESLAAARAQGAATIAFPSISTGAYGYPIDEAARIALGTVCAEAPRLRFAEVRFCLFSAGDLAVYEAALGEVVGERRQGSAPVSLQGAMAVESSRPRPRKGESTSVNGGV